MIGGDAAPQSPPVILMVFPKTGPDCTSAPERSKKFYLVEDVPSR